MGLVQSNGSQDLVLKTVWYAGTTTLKEGQALAYDNDDTNAPVTPAAPLGSTSERNVRGRRVIDVVAGVTGGFAGAVSSQSAGVIGPAFVEIIVPRKGDFALLWCKVNATKNSTIVGIDTATPSNNFVSKADATFNFDAIAIAYETKDTSTTAGLTLCRFL